MYAIWNEEAKIFYKITFDDLQVAIHTRQLLEEKTGVKHTIYVKLR